MDQTSLCKCIAFCQQIATSTFLSYEDSSKPVIMHSHARAFTARVDEKNKKATGNVPLIAFSSKECSVEFMTMHRLARAFAARVNETKIGKLGMCRIVLHSIHIEGMFFQGGLFSQTQEHSWPLLTLTHLKWYHFRHFLFSHLLYFLGAGRRHRD